MERIAGCLSKDEYKQVFLTIILSQFGNLKIYGMKVSSPTVGERGIVKNGKYKPLSK